MYSLYHFLDFYVNYGRGQRKSSWVVENVNFRFAAEKITLSYRPQKIFGKLNHFHITTRKYNSVISTYNISVDDGSQPSDIGILQ